MKWACETDLQPRSCTGERGVVVWALSVPALLFPLTALQSPSWPQNEGQKNLKTVTPIFKVGLTLGKRRLSEHVTWGITEGLQLASLKLV